MDSKNWEFLNDNIKHFCDYLLYLIVVKIQQALENKKYDFTKFYRIFRQCMKKDHTETRPASRIL